MAVESERVTIRVPVQDLRDLEMFLQAGMYANLSDVIRAAIADFVTNRAQEVKAKMDARKQLMESVSQVQQLRELQEQLKAQQEQIQRLLQK